MSKINYVVKCAGERLRSSVSGVYRKIAVKLAQPLKRGAKRTNIAAVKVAPAVRVGKESVTADEHVLAKKARRAARVSGSCDDLQLGIAKAYRVAVLKSALGTIESAVLAKEGLEGVFISVREHLGVVLVNVSGRTRPRAQSVKRENVIKMPVSEQYRVKHEGALGEKLYYILLGHAWVYDYRVRAVRENVAI